MIEKSIWNKILELTLIKFKQGNELYLDDLTREFNPNILDANIKYLVQHKLLEVELSCLEDEFGYASLTEKGIDFLDESGGLTTEINSKLNTSIIKIDNEQFKALLISRINQLDIPETERNTLLETVTQMPSITLEHLATKLLDYGLENLSSAVQSIGM